MSEGPDTRRPYFAHPTAVIDGQTAGNGFVDPGIGAGTRIWHFCHVAAGARIGPDCVLGQGVYVAPTVVVGRGCRVQNHVSLYDGVVLEDHVFCGPSMVFTNVSKPLPRAAISRRDAFLRTVVRRDASIGAGAVIVCGHELGEACFVAAGAVVTRDVPAFALVAGNPARRIGWVCRCGARLAFVDGRARCDGGWQDAGVRVPCGRTYRLEGADAVIPVDDPHPPA